MERDNTFVLHVVRVEIEHEEGVVLGEDLVGQANTFIKLMKYSFKQKKSNKLTKTHIL